MKRILVLSTVGLLVLVSLVVIGVAVIRPVFETKPGPHAQFAYPIVWQTSRAPDPEQVSSSELTLNEDGTADFIDIQFGGIGRTGDGRQCVEDPHDVSSGRGTWEIDGDGVLRVTSDAGGAVFLPGRGRFSGADWSELRQPFCDLTFVDFSPIMQLQ